MDKDESDPRLIKKLLQAGLYGAYVRKRDYTAIVLTIQGFRSKVDPLVGALWEYLNQTGGAVRCSIQEERAIAHELYHIIPEKLPEIVGKVEYMEKDMKIKYLKSVREMRQIGIPVSREKANLLK
ncbi:MAG: hypothetical protein AABX38_07450 [Candidatus Micrarchaeota archaeon]